MTEVAVIVWPWAEANQGFLSILALAAALSVALFEYFRAERAEQKRERDYVRLVTDLLDGLRWRLDELAAKEPTQEILLSDTVGDWNAHIGKAFQAVEAIIPAVPPNAKLALLMFDIRESFRLNEIAIGTNTSALDARIVGLQEMIGRLRRGIIATVRS